MKYISNYRLLTDKILYDIYFNVCRLCEISISDCDGCRFFKICTDVIDYMEDRYADV